MKKRVSTLLYCLEEQIEAVLTSMNVTEEEKHVYNIVIVKIRCLQGTEEYYFRTGEV